MAFPMTTLLGLPAELRNQIYNYIAYDQIAVKILAHDNIVTVPPPLSQTSQQARTEFGGICRLVPFDHATQITIVNNNFCIWELVLSLGKVPVKPAAGVTRSILLQIRITGSLETDAIGLFVKALAGEIAEVPSSDNVVRPLRYRVVFDEDNLDLHTLRLTFARLSKRYRFHHSEGEQRVFEKIYWAFAQRAEKIDGVSVKQYTTGYWYREGGALSFV